MNLIEGLKGAGSVRLRLILLLGIVLLVSLIGCILTAVMINEKSPGDRTSHTTSETLGLSATFELNKSTYNIGEPIIATLTIQNITSHAIKLSKGGDYRAGRRERWGFSVTDETGKSVPDPLLIFVSSNMSGGLGGWDNLAPGETYTVSTLLNLYATARASGRYTVAGDYQTTDNPVGNPQEGLAWKPVRFRVRNWSSSMSERQGLALFAKHKLDEIHPCILYGLQNSTGRIPQLIEMIEQFAPPSGKIPPSLAERNAHVEAMKALVLMPDKSAVYRAFEKQVVARWPKPSANHDNDYFNHHPIHEPLGYIYQCAITPESVPIIERSFDHPNAYVADLAFWTALSMGSGKALERLPAALRSDNAGTSREAREHAFKYLIMLQAYGAPPRDIAQYMSIEHASEYGDALIDGFRQEKGGRTEKAAEACPERCLFSYLLNFHFAACRFWDAMEIAVESDSPAKHLAALYYLSSYNQMPGFALTKEQIAQLTPFVRRQMQTHPDVGGRARAMRCLGQWGDAESIPALAQALDAPEKPLRLAAAGALILLRHKPLLEKSIERIVDEDEDLKPRHVFWVASRLGMEYAELQRLELPASPTAAPVPRTTDTFAGNPNNPASDEPASRTIREMRDRRKAALRRLSGEAAP
ncbi:MAG: hypothetical protein NTX50_30075 [Candidatus Sumerlaeota bacterium]|nr:hypothetical protein [Candidatus Sumerlaeota bacterium]